MVKVPTYSSRSCGCWAASKLIEVVETDRLDRHPKMWSRGLSPSLLEGRYVPMMCDITIRYIRICSVAVLDERLKD